MKLEKQGKNKGLEDRSILNSELIDKKGNKIIVDTAYLGGAAIMMDTFFEGKDTTGEIEMMVSLNGNWINRTQKRYKTKKEAIKDHKKIVELFVKGGINKILTFKETAGGGEFLSETDKDLKEKMR